MNDAICRADVSRFFVLLPAALSSSVQHNFTFMPLGGTGEKVLHLHTLRRRRGRQTSTFEHAEEFCGRQT